MRATAPAAHPTATPPTGFESHLPSCERPRLRGVLGRDHIARTGFRAACAKPSSIRWRFGRAAQELERERCLATRFESHPPSLPNARTAGISLCRYDYAWPILPSDCKVRIVSDKDPLDFFVPAVIFAFVLFGVLGLLVVGVVALF